MLEALSRICDGEGTPQDLDRLIALGEKIKEYSLCGLGKTAPNPVLTTAAYFRDEYDAHILESACPARVCKPLLRYVVDPESCKDCKLCVKECPAEAISQGSGPYQTIDPVLCVKCGRCREACPFAAIEIVTGKVKA